MVAPALHVGSRNLRRLKSSAQRIIALEFKRSLWSRNGKESIVQVRTVVLLALLAIVRKVMILDQASTEALQLFALAVANPRSWCCLLASTRPRSQHRTRSVSAAP